MSEIKKVLAREVLDSRGNPTVEADVFTERFSVSAMVPSGASTGKHEALEMRDNDPERYNGKGVLKAVDNVNKIISKKIIGMDCTKQKEIDNFMIKLDGTENKSKLGANAILAVSMAVCKAGAAEKNMPLYKYIANLGGNDNIILPVPMVLVLEGGKHADQSSDIQEFMVMPCKAKTFREAIRWGSEIYHSIGKVLKKQGFNINVGYEGAYGPSLGSNERVFQVIVEGIKEAGYKPLDEVKIAIDGAASEFFENGKYNLKVDGRALDGRGMADFYSELAGKYPIASIEDGLAEDDWDSWKFLMEKIGEKVQIVGDDLVVTNVKRLQKAIDMKAINSVLIKLNQIGTVTETIDAINLARKNGCTSVVSHRSAETEDTFIADFVVGMETGQCKFGATARSERTAKYNRLMKIEEELGERAKFARF
ncbi:phosphopyruvate hydratase [Candidatus Woesearchaeota archaeon]|nr:phosphopyruvate hydratase [Candidatus Woesearchaeota archaeon]